MKVLIGATENARVEKANQMTWVENEVCLSANQYHGKMAEWIRMALGWLVGSAFLVGY